ncbi:MAG TPA: hypothetical protein VEJ42_03980 [Streptosporangiaceae bacterium]|nr:hypothetical protein [Streptosporangiaceae bacterium]
MPPDVAWLGPLAGCGGWLGITMEPPSFGVVAVLLLFCVAGVLLLFGVAGVLPPPFCAAELLLPPVPVPPLAASAA